MSSVDFSRLPEIHFAPIDTGETERDVIASYERLTGITLQPGDPVRLFLESLAYVISVQNGLIDLAGRQNLLAYATGAHLDHLGALMGVYRLPPQNAICLIRFSIGSALAFAVPIPEGTRVATQDGSVIFATVSPGEIAAGSLYCDVLAQSVEAGQKTSGLLQDQICVLADPLPYVNSVSNITVTSDGSDQEDDERLRERIRIAPESYTVAGSSGAYEARTLEASAEIETVSVFSPEPGVVDVRFALKDGELPDEAMIELVREHLCAETVRPLTDNVLVGAPDVVEFSVKGSWYLRRADASLLSSIATAVNQALENYRLWQRSRPGRDIVPDQLIKMLIEAGAKRVVLDEPVFTPLEPYQIAREVSIELEFAGMEEE